MKKIIEYIILHGDSHLILGSAVQRGIEEGYQPYGSPYTVDSQHYQTIVKYEKPVEINKKQLL